MIAFVRGQVAAVAPDTRRRRGRRGRPRAACARPAPSPTLRVGQPATLATSLVVREDSLTLFGFADDDERQVFELLQTVSGVGPRLAQAMLAVHEPGRAAPRGRRPRTSSALTAVPGHRPKGAQRLVLELKDRLGAAASAPAPAPAPAAATAAAWRDQVHAGLRRPRLVGHARPTRRVDAVAAARPARAAARRRRRCCAPPCAR